ncbi:hypothetical protein BN10_1210015 [Phycicoccus elongatus Lp2]|uniref:Ppx/GppA phosphatase N-terminal domain-containing protein n=1 Tax=Phycicoccus elongatus Lp2 TaxID=1193181 RepID=N0E1T6_9MICO|nr:hypothetical protein BN10_1210015 [Phycicoccus elongatus Lp2]
MRLGVIDVGSNTVHLLVVDAHSGGAQPLPTSSHKIALRLSEHVEDDGRIADAGRERLAEFVDECLHVGEDQGVEELMGFATSAIREAPNGDEVLAFVKERTGVGLDVLSGPDEAKLTFLAIRRWFGWSAGTLLMVDIGGGSLELAQGLDEDPDVAVSLCHSAPAASPATCWPAIRPARRPCAKRADECARCWPRRCARSPRRPTPTAPSARPRRCGRWRASAVPLRARRGCMPRVISTGRCCPRCCPSWPR